MALTFTKEVGKYVIGGLTGTGITLASLLAWTGAEDLTTIKSSVDTYVTQADGQVNALLSEYSVTVDNANAEIGEYKEALEQANSNIDTLILGVMAKDQELTAKQEQLATKEQELATKQAEFESLQGDFTELQGDFAKLQTQLKENYVSVGEVNEIIAKANEEIGQANQQVASTKNEVQGKIGESNITKQSVEERLANTGKVLDVEEGKPTVNDITGIVE